MAKTKVVITVVADDRPGVVQTLSDTALEAGANWLDSSLSHLYGKFAGIVRFEIDADSKSELLDAMHALSAQGITVLADDDVPPPADKLGETVELYVEANDRAGIVEEITSALAAAAINVEQMETWRESASMAGYDLFIAQMAVTLPVDLSVDDLEAALENVSDDLMVSIVSD